MHQPAVGVTSVCRNFWASALATVPQIHLQGDLKYIMLLLKSIIQYNMNMICVNLVSSTVSLASQETVTATNQVNERGGWK